MVGHASSEVTLRANISAMPSSKLLSSMNKGFYVYCNVCTSFIDSKRSNHIKQHIENKEHSESVALKRPRQLIIETILAAKRVEDSFNREFTKL